MGLANGEYVEYAWYSRERECRRGFTTGDQAGTSRMAEKRSIGQSAGSNYGGPR